MKLQSFLVTAGLACTMWMGCSNGSTTPADGVAEDQKAVDVHRSEVPTPIDVKIDGVGKDVIFIVPDVPVEDNLLVEIDLGPQDIEPFDEQPQCEGAPLPFGCPCESNGDCAVGWCIDSKDGKICTMACEEECPKGFECTEMPGTCPDCEFVCVPKWVELCRPCISNDICQQAGLAPQNFCIDLGADGSFCGHHCDTEIDCPDGYLCQDAETKNGLQKQCQPEGGMCDCSKAAIATQATTECFVQNTFGKCSGERFCGDDGLSDCDAVEPVKEVCDGLDNECDGLIDEDEDICENGRICLCAGPDCDCICPEGLTDCGDGVCADTKSEVAHCGGCGEPCDEDHVETYLCQAGECKIAKCEAGWENFDGLYPGGCECEILPEVCDGIDNDCDGAIDEGEEACPGQGDCVGTCNDGLCECSAGCDYCDGICVPLLNYFEDPNNCGYCGNNCALPETSVHGCEGGNCIPVACNQGFADCNDVWSDGCEWTVEQEKCNCVDDDCDGEFDELPLADCDPPKQCVDCFCQCPKDDPNVLDCGEDGCRDITTDPLHCGWCGNDCVNSDWPGVKQFGCADSQCTILGCDAGFFDVNETTWDGCECEKTSSAELCDLVDNDCDGLVDEVPLTDCPAPKICEFGFCSCPLDQPNLQECLDNQCIDVYTNAAHCGFCDNGCVDLAWDNVQQYKCEEGMCGVLSCQSPWFNVNEMDFDGCECEKTSASEICDLVDNNCNGEFDEFPNNCMPPMVCIGGGCICPPDQPNLQDCGDGKCSDTSTDSKNCGFCTNQCQLDNVAYQKCEEGLCVVPACKPGFKDCNGIAFDGCEFEVNVEECNGFDDDCDGEIDENPMGINQQCNSGLPGLCENGLTKCQNGGIQCISNIAPGQYDEVCDNKDNDCDGQIDNGNPGGGGPCSVAGLQGECKVGVLECQNGSPICIQTVFPQDEACDAKDNNCDGVVDGFSENCFTDCGNGKKTCNGGVWGACSAMEPKLCKNYDNCQMESMCLQQCPQAPAEQCNGQDDNCSGSVDETFACILGAQKDQNCGNCGTQWSTCNNNCSWGGWGSCEGQGVCQSGQKKTDGTCDKCGQSQYTCSNSCYWDYSGCINQGSCNPGETKLEGSCGNCGKKKYQCTNSCTWSYVGCENEGVCSSGSTKYEGSCGNCGSQKWTCSNSCSWSKSSCTSQGTCSPGSTKYDGSCGDCGQNKYSCSNSCSWSKLSGCYSEGVCSPGDKMACDGCKAKVCSNSCSWGSCGSSNVCGYKGEGGCYCDSLCAASGDCCPGSDSSSACGACGYGCNSCEQQECGGSGGNCWCDSGCVNYGDCCNDSRDDCDVPTCAGHCGDEFPGTAGLGCDCDWNCWLTSCCTDKEGECG
jgi:hypothetical protein